MIEDDGICADIQTGKPAETPLLLTEYQLTRRDVVTSISSSGDYVKARVLVYETAGAV
jgi:hypothetical protein